MSKNSKNKMSEGMITSLYEDTDSGIPMGEANPLNDWKPSSSKEKAHFESATFSYSQGFKEREALKKEIAHLNMEVGRHDLTKLVNWTSEIGQKLITRELELAKERNLDVSLALIDIDFLHTLNKVYSHSMVNSAILSLTDAVTESVRETDTMYRNPGGSINDYETDGSFFHAGGDEYPLLLIGARNENIPVIMKRIRDKTSEKLAILAEEGVIKKDLVNDFTFTVGVASGRKKLDQGGYEYLKPEILMNNSDRLLLQGKEFGRNGVYVGSDAGDDTKMIVIKYKDKYSPALQAQVVNNTRYYTEDTKMTPEGVAVVKLLVGNDIVNNNKKSDIVPQETIEQQ